MRLASGVTVVVVAALLPTTAFAAAPPVSRAEEIMREWERSYAERREYSGRFTQTRTDWVTEETQTHQGQVWVQRPDRIRIELRDGGQQPSTVLLVDGTTARWYEDRSKRETVISRAEARRALVWARPAAEKAGFVWGLPIGLGVLLPAAMAEEAPAQFAGRPPLEWKKRFRVRVEKEDAHWIYVSLERQRNSPPGFNSADRQVVLARDGYWLRREVQDEANLTRTVTEYMEPVPGRAARTTWQPLWDTPPEGWERIEMDAGWFKQMKEMDPDRNSH
jgi:hypothetical protein